MAILTREEILKEIKKGNIRIEPYDPNCVGPGSIDLTLSNKFRVFKNTHEVVDVNNDVDYKKITRLLEADDIIVKPGETILGITEEKVTLAPGFAGWLEGRSRFARLGLMVHISASFMQPGISNQQVLEISNMGHVPLRLHAGIKICQFIFETTQGKDTYKGIFSGQQEP